MVALAIWLWVEGREEVRVREITHALQHLNRGDAVIFRDGRHGEVVQGRESPPVGISTLDGEMTLPIVIMEIYGPGDGKWEGRMTYAVHRVGAIAPDIERVELKGVPDPRPTTP